MLHARSQHPNAPLTPEGRRRMIGCVVDQAGRCRPSWSGSRSMPKNSATLCHRRVDA